MSLGQANSSNGQILQPTRRKSSYPQASRTYYEELQSKIFTSESSLTCSGHVVCNQELVNDIEGFKVLTEVWKVNSLFPHHEIQGTDCSTSGREGEQKGGEGSIHMMSWEHKTSTDFYNRGQ